MYRTIIKSVVQRTVLGILTMWMPINGMSNKYETSENEDADSNSGTHIKSCPQVS